MSATSSNASHRASPPNLRDFLFVSAILDYFAPLQVWLREQNKGQPIGW
jgi:hypothetical protein